MSLSNPFKLKISIKYCFLCGISYLNENKKICIFAVLKNKFCSWKLIIPELKQASFLCENHFDETDVVKGFSDGKYFHRYERWRLSSSAVPKHHLGITIVTVLYYMLVITLLSIGKQEASTKVSSRTPLKKLFTVKKQQKQCDVIQTTISNVQSASNRLQKLPPLLGNAANSQKRLKRTFGSENTPPNQDEKKCKLNSKFFKIESLFY
jgi:hypothetical protein